MISGCIIAGMSGGTFVGIHRLLSVRSALVSVIIDVLQYYRRCFRIWDLQGFDFIIANMDSVPAGTCPE